jgi:carbon-monoxide dehydrogenase medium subunit
MKPAPFTYARARSVPEALAMLGADAHSLPLAGGQSLAPMLNLRMTICESLVDIGAIEELLVASETKDHVTIGAAITHAMIEDGLVPDPAHGMMRRAACKIAYRAIRCHGTIGGSVAMADPAADWPCILLALDAVAIVAGESGDRRIPLDRLLVGTYETSLQPGEIIRAFEIPKLPADARATTSKINRKTGAFADSIVTAVRNGDKSKVVLGAAGPRAQILENASRAMVNQVAGPALDQAIATDISGMLPENDAYLKHLHAINVKRAIDEVMTP